VSRPQFDRALEALINGVTLVITTLDRLGRSTQNMLAFADELHARGAGLRVLNLSGGDVVFIDTSPGTTGIGALPRIAAIATAYAGTTSEPADLITSNDRLWAAA
jgi:DNA invertase Pin-like site-specific DNA recombinase